MNLMEFNFIGKFLFHRERDTLSPILAIVGANGAGKTTLVKLICGLYSPTSGEIKINGYKTEESQIS